MNSTYAALRCSGSNCPSVCLISLLKTFHHEGCKWSPVKRLWSSMQSVSAAWEVDVSRAAAILAPRSITKSLLPTALGFQFAACWKKFWKVSTGVKIFTKMSFMFLLRALNISNLSISEPADRCVHLKFFKTCIVLEDKSLRLMLLFTAASSASSHQDTQNCSDSQPWTLQHFKSQPTLCKSLKDGGPDPLVLY